jgi:hypothetical protein
MCDRDRTAVRKASPRRLSGTVLQAEPVFSTLKNKGNPESTKGFSIPDLSFPSLKKTKSRNFVDPHLQATQFRLFF